MNLNRIETALDVALIRSRAGSCPPKLAAALEYAVKRVAPASVPRSA